VTHLVRHRACILRVRPGDGCHIDPIILVIHAHRTNWSEPHGCSGEIFSRQHLCIVVVGKDSQIRESPFSELRKQISDVLLRCGPCAR
jgi:hypothetical protein